MLNSIVRFSVRHRTVVLALGILSLGYGAFIAARSKLDVFPEFAPPLVVIHTNAPGLSAEQVEQLVSRPIENAVNGVAGISALRSASIQGLSVVTAIFSESTPILEARQLVAERLTEVAASLPSNAESPVMAPLTSSTSLVMMAGLTSDRRTPRELRQFADYVLTPRLLGVPGVAKVVVFGGEERQIQIQLEPRRMKKYGISFDEVAAAAKNVTGVKGAGFIETDAQRLVLKTVGQALTADKLAEAVIRRTQGMSVKLEDLGTVVEAHEPKFGDAQILGTPGIALLISDQYGANTLEVTGQLDKAFKEMIPEAKAGGMDLRTDLFRPATFIDTALSNIRSSLVFGGILVVIVLFLFLWNWRVSVISLTAIPLSLLVAVIVLDLLGISLNTLTIGGLAIAIGEVVDDAVIDVENIFRRLRENLRLTKPHGRLATVFHASLEVRHAVVYATFVVILVFLPVVTMTGVQGRLFAPLGWAYIFAILASLLVALTITPALSAIMLHDRALEHGEPQWIAQLKGAYHRLLAQILERPKRIVAACIALSLVAIATIPFFGGSFLPEFEEGHFIVHISMLPGTSLKESIRYGTRVTEALMQIPEVRLVSQTAGTADNADDVMGTFESELNVDLKPNLSEDPEEVQAKVRQVLTKFPGAYFSMNSFLSERIDETVAGSTADVVIKVFGEDLNALDGISNDFVALLSKMQGAVDVQREAQPTVPELSIVLKPEALVREGFAPVDVLEAVETAYQGTKVSQVYEGNRVTNVAVVLAKEIRARPEEVAALPLRNADGKWVRLGDLADIKLGSGRYSVLHEGTRRREVVTCNVRGRDVASFARELQSRIGADVKVPSGIQVVVSGAAQARSKAIQEILVRSALALGGILLLLFLAFGGGRNLLLVLANLPFALVGGALAVFASGGLLSLGAMVGFVTLFGITMRNSIMLVSHYEHLVKSEGASWGVETAIRGATERLLPILMTVSVTALGLLPLAIGAGSPGREIEGPMAIVILGGLLSSTALNLLVLPALVLRFGGFTREAEEDLSEMEKGR